MSSGFVVGKPTIIAPTTYRFRYSGDPIVLTASTVDVLQRTPGTRVAVAELGLPDLGLLQLSTFPNSTVQNLTVVQKDGYLVSLDLENGTVSVSDTTSRDVILQAEGSTEALPDAELLRIAETFVTTHGIAVTAYGKPEVSAATTIAYTAGVRDSMLRPDFAMPDAAVLYPLVVDGRSVYSSWGEKIGMTVNINLRTKRVTGLYNLTTQNYQSSAYAAETDPAVIVKVAERGGVYGFASDATDPVTEIQLGTPERVWAWLSRYENGKNLDLLVPALRFPINKPPAGFQSAVVVPLAKDLVAPEPMPVPLPLEGGGTTESVPPSKVNP
jgi:hypothetical protein